MKISSLKAVLTLTALSLLLYSCSTNDPFAIPPPDFSSVPDPYNFDNIEPQTIEEGVVKYLHEEGLGNFLVTVRDEIFVFMTLRTEDGEIIYSSYANENENPVPITVRTSGSIQNVADFRSILVSYTPGLKAGIMGMRQGERRTIVVSPEKGYGNASVNNPNADRREDVLIYDIKVSTINPG